MAVLIYESQLYQFVTSYTDDTTGDPSYKCQYFSKAIYCPSCHSTIPEKYLDCLDGVLLQPPLLSYDTDQTSPQDTNCSDRTSPPSFTIGTNRANFQSIAIPAVGTPPVPLLANAWFVPMVKDGGDVRSEQLVYCGDV